MIFKRTCVLDLAAWCVRLKFDVIFDPIIGHKLHIFWSSMDMRHSPFTRSIFFMAHLSPILVKAKPVKKKRKKT